MTRIERLRHAIKAAGHEALLVTQSENVRYLTGFTGSFGSAIITHTQAIFITDSRYAIQACEQCADFDVRWFQAPTEQLEFLGAQLQSFAINRLGFESTAVTVALLERWQQKLPEVKFEPAPDLIAPLRLVKDESEVARIRDAVGIVDAGFRHIQRLLQVGAVEYDIALELEFFIRRHSAQIGFPPIVVSGHRSALPHGSPSEKRIVNGDLVTLDFGACKAGYNSDITRTVIVGSASDETRRIYGAVLEAQARALDAMKPGARASEVDGIARESLAAHGLAKHFGHGLGHSLGIGVHDGAALNPTSTVVLEAGQVWTVEPGVYIEGFGGVRIEDDVLLNDHGIEVLTQSPKELLEFDG